MGRPTTRYVGERRGYLEVLSIIPQNKGGRHVQLELLCHACGGKTTQSSVVFRKAKSCGCERNKPDVGKPPLTKKMPWQLPKGEAARRLLINRYKRSAKSKGLVFELTEEELSVLFKSPCNYCGQSETNLCKGLGKTSGDYSYVGIDRVDPSLGYVLNNVAPCCWVCNMMKNTLEEQFFLSHITKIHNYRRLKLVDKS